MAFKLDDIIIDRIQYGLATDFDDNPLYALTQLSEGTINITAESKDAVDATGTLIKRFWQGKSGEFSAQNAMINLNVVGAASGEGKVTVSSETPMDMPKIMTVKAGEEVTLTNYVEGTVTVNGFGTNGSLGTAYTLGNAASETEFAISENVLKLPESKDDTLFIVKYQRKVTSGVYIANKSDKFPQTVKLYLKALAVDPCSADTLRAVYIVLPSFQVSPEIEISMTTDTQLNYTGALQVDYCSADKVLYEIYFAEEDEE